MPGAYRAHSAKHSRLRNGHVGTRSYSVDDLNNLAGVFGVEGEPWAPKKAEHKGEQSRVTENRDNSNEAKKLPPYTGTTSDGSRTGAPARPPAKPPAGRAVPSGGAVKPPSTSFLKPEKPASDDPLRAELARLTEGAEEEKPKIPPPPPPRPEAEAKESPRVDQSNSEVAQASAREPDLLGPASEPEEMKLEQGNDPRLAAEIKELMDIVAGLESLTFLRPRVEKFTREGADLSALVSVYRLTSRTLKDELNEKNKMLDQFRKEFQKQRVALEEARKKEVPPSRPLADPADTDKLNKEIKSLQDQVDASQEQRNRLLQDFQNMRNRIQIDTDLKVHREKETLIKKVLPVVDGFDRALETVRSATETDEVVRGIEMLFRILMEALESEGLSPVITKDQMFDPRCHEAMGQVVTADVPEDSVFDELNKGYYLGERLLRPAMVRIAKAPEGGAPPPAVKPPPEMPGPEPPREEVSDPSEGASGEENVES